MNTAGYIYQIAQSTVIIPEAGWAKEGALWVCAIVDANVREDTDVDVFVERESIGVPLCTVAEPQNGRAKLYAYAKPDEDIRATIRVSEVRA